MITVIKQSPQGEEKTRYPAEIHTHLANGIILHARWSQPRKELGYTTFEPGDLFTEYFYTDRWFNIFAIASADGQRKGWYCNIAAPALIKTVQVEQRDLLLDVWVNAQGQPLILDEDEFAADTSLTELQRRGALHGLAELLALIADQHEPFSSSLSISSGSPAEKGEQETLF